MNELQKIIDHYGEEHQIRKLMEECGELIQAVNKWYDERTEDARRNLIEEMADVELTVLQVRKMANITMEEVDEVYKAKYYRTFERMEVRK